MKTKYTITRTRTLEVTVEGMERPNISSNPDMFPGTIGADHLAETVEAIAAKQGVEYGPEKVVVGLTSA